MKSNNYILRSDGSAMQWEWLKRKNQKNWPETKTETQPWQRIEVLQMIVERKELKKSKEQIYNDHGS